jgi:hypothetical protein
MDMSSLFSVLAGLGVAFAIVMLAICVFMVIVFWLLFAKAGQPGWAAIIPIYNILILLKVAGKPWWWIFGFILVLIPILGSILVLVLDVLIFHGVSKNFGKDAGFTVGLVLLGFVFFPILAFGSAVYQPVLPNAQPGASRPAE